MRGVRELKRKVKKLKLFILREIIKNKIYLFIMVITIKGINESHFFSLDK